MSREMDRAMAFGYVVRQYQAAVDDYDRLAARTLGVNQTDARCLELLLFDHPGGATPAALGAALALTSGSVTTMTDRLVRAGFVERRRHPDDRRTVLVVPTERARTEAVGMRRSLVERGAALVASYSADEIATMTDFLVRATSLQREEEAALRARSTTDD